MPVFTKYLGQDRNGFEYKLYSDNYVYQFKGPVKCYGWFCSGPAWERTLHKILDI
jgi:hypothetical protein